MIDFDFETTKKGTLVVRIRGFLDHESNEYFFDCVKEQVGNGHKHIVINCEGLGHLTSVGLGAMVRARARTAKAGGTIYLARVDAKIMQVFSLVKFDRLFDIFPTEREAIESIEG